MITCTDKASTIDNVLELIYTIYRDREIAFSIGITNEYRSTTIGKRKLRNILLSLSEKDLEDLKVRFDKIQKYKSKLRMLGISIDINLQIVDRSNDREFITELCTIKSLINSNIEIQLGALDNGNIWLNWELFLNNYTNSTVLDIGGLNLEILNTNTIFSLIMFMYQGYILSTKKNSPSRYVFYYTEPSNSLRVRYNLQMINKLAEKLKNIYTEVSIWSSKINYGYKELLSSLMRIWSLKMIDITQVDTPIGTITGRNLQLLGQFKSGYIGKGYITYKDDMVFVDVKDLDDILSILVTIITNTFVTSQESVKIEDKVETEIDLGDLGSDLKSNYYTELFKLDTITKRIKQELESSEH
jgi:hypothetical protein